MTTSEFVRNLWENSGDYTTKMDITTAQNDLDTFRAEGWDVPDDLTAEEYAEAWNDLVDSIAKEDTTTKRINICTILTNDSDTERQTISWDATTGHLYSDHMDSDCPAYDATFQTLEDAEDACLEIWGRNPAWALEWIERDE